MKRFILDSPPDSDGIIHLYDKAYRHLVTVRRLGSGSKFDALLPDGRETVVTILSTVDKILIGKVDAECGQSKTSAVPASIDLPRLILFQGLPKGSKMDLIVRQAAEAGVSEIVPFRSEYCAVKIDGQTAKPERWERIVKEARQQSGSVIPTVINKPVDVPGLMKRWRELKNGESEGAGFFFHQDPLEQGTLHDYLYNLKDFAVLVIGPEGGFSGHEISVFSENGLKPIFLGNTILRTETAALYGVAAIRTIILEKSSWMPMKTR